MNFILAILSLPLLSAFLSCIFYKVPALRNILVIAVSIFASVLSFQLTQTSQVFSSTVLFGFFVINTEPLTTIFLCMTSSLWAITNLYSWSYLKMNPSVNATKIYALISISMFCTFGIALSGNLLTTFIFYELLTILTYPLVASFGTKYKSAAAGKYVLILLLTSLVLFLPAILIIESITGSTAFAIGGIMAPISNTVGLVLLLMFLYGVAKTAIIPVHSWLPNAMIAPMPVTAVLHAVAVVKSGVFIILKIVIYIFGLNYLQKLTENLNVITILCAGSVIISSLIALRQTQIKKLLAYSTINQLSICLLAVSMFYPLAIKAAVLHMISHAYGKIGLFFAVGNIQSHYNVVKIKDLAGLGKRMKFTFVIFTISALSIIGVPILAGFVSKAYVLWAALSGQINYLVVVALALSIVASAHYFMKILSTAYYKKESEVTKKSNPKSYSMQIAMFITCVVVVSYCLIYKYVLAMLDQIVYAAS